MKELSLAGKGVIVPMDVQLLALFALIALSLILCVFRRYRAALYSFGLAASAIFIPFLKDIVITILPWWLALPLTLIVFLVVTKALISIFFGDAVADQAIGQYIGTLLQKLFILPFIFAGSIFHLVRSPVLIDFIKGITTLRHSKTKIADPSPSASQNDDYDDQGLCTDTDKDDAEGTKYSKPALEESDNIKNTTEGVIIDMPSNSSATKKDQCKIHGSQHNESSQDDKLLSPADIASQAENNSDRTLTKEMEN